MIKKIFISIGEYVLFMKKVFRRPEKGRIFLRQFINESDKLILSSVLLVGVISLFIGGVLVIQTASNLENPLISPLKVSPEQLAGFPSTYIQAGEKEILLEDIFFFTFHI